MLGLVVCWGWSYVGVGRMLEGVAVNGGGEVGSDRMLESGMQFRLSKSVTTKCYFAESLKIYKVKVGRFI